MEFKSRIVKFSSSNLANELADLTSEEIDELSFGAVQVDGDGTIHRYNAAEGEISGREPEEMVGQNFFSIAPCTKGEQFEGRFNEGVSTGSLNTTIVYNFDYKMEPTQVQVRMEGSSDDDRYWILVKRI